MKSVWVIVNDGNKWGAIKDLGQGMEDGYGKVERGNVSESIISQHLSLLGWRMLGLKG